LISPKTIDLCLWRVLNKKLDVLRKMNLSKQHLPFINEQYELEFKSYLEEIRSRSDNSSEEDESGEEWSPKLGDETEDDEESGNCRCRRHEVLGGGSRRPLRLY
jgi:hypothetical protein